MLLWTGIGTKAVIKSDVGPFKNETTHLSRSKFKNVDIVIIGQDRDTITFTKQEAEAMVRYLTSVIPSMKEALNAN
ncbi:Hypothetical protein KNT65_gp110 [Escherichia phage EcS1]|uniref:T4 y05I-like putative transcription factor C-terminal domain-containing protein n=1 Tax=Escherichia phage EcS1 TaxID=2083276 RepID=A0A2Z5ZC19_9CAUD|nr:Hypothetical protein KNT65_gp110 [Escherichia phage EcS1]BBC78158.1 Hypothetical protein [Escherichia phage EcS1]